MDRAAFYAALRKRNSGLFGTSLNQSQVDNLEVLITEAELRGLPLHHLAYVLATVYHEVGSAMKPVAENLYYSTAARIRAVWPSRFATVASAQPYAKNPEKLANKVYANRMGNGPEASGDGWRYRGRGYVQLTGKINYERGSSVVGIDLVKDPDRALEPRVAAMLMCDGMAHGTFTGQRLSSYIKDNKADYVNARAIINGDVRANGEKIARYAHSFELALGAAGYDAVTPPLMHIEPHELVPTPEPISAPPSTNWVARIVETIMKVFKWQR